MVKLGATNKPTPSSQTRHGPSRAQATAAGRSTASAPPPASGIGWPAAQQVLRIRRDSGTTRGPWEHSEFALGIRNLPASLAGPRHLAAYARQQRILALYGYA